MPLRPLTRDQISMLPHSLDELLPKGHPARFVDALIDGLSRDDWERMGIDLQGNRMGAASYRPEVMLKVWVYGFMTGLRSSRELELACRERMPFIWLTGQQYPDHNTLWRFYKRHREGMGHLLTLSVGMAAQMGLARFALQAVDGTKVWANASRERTYDAAGIERLMGRTEKAIDELEAKNEGEGGEASERLASELEDKGALMEALKEAAAELEREGLSKINLTDPEARLMKGRSGIAPSYNAQAMASPTEDDAGNRGMLITAAEVCDDPSDQSQLAPMLAAAEEATGVRAEETLADGGYHSGSNLEECEARGQRVVMPESQGKALGKPYHKDNFAYDEGSDSYECPEGERLPFARVKLTRGERVRVYRASGEVCGACPAFGECTKDGRHGRAIEIGPRDGVLRRHREMMKTDGAKERYKLRAPLIEGVFGIMKERMGARRFLLRGRRNVAAEWSLLAFAFNLRVLSRAWGARTERSEGLWGPVGGSYGPFCGLAEAILLATGWWAARWASSAPSALGRWAVDAAATPQPALLSIGQHKL